MDLRVASTKRLAGPAEHHPPRGAQFELGSVEDQSLLDSKESVEPRWRTVFLKRNTVIWTGESARTGGTGGSPGGLKCGESRFWVVAPR